VQEVLVGRARGPQDEDEDVAQDQDEVHLRLVLCARFDSGTPEVFYFC
jgi:hypothetical protein